jgi:hypothetical protein
MYYIGWAAGVESIEGKNDDELRGMNVGFADG